MLLYSDWGDSLKAVRLFDQALAKYEIALRLAPDDAWLRSEVEKIRTKNYQAES